MLETMIAISLLITGIAFDEPLYVLASSLYAVAVNIGNIARKRE